MVHRRFDRRRPAAAQNPERPLAENVGWFPETKGVSPECPCENPECWGKQPDVRPPLFPAGEVAGNFRAAIEGMRR